jgi:Sulfotransferase family
MCAVMGAVSGHNDKVSRSSQDERIEDDLLKRRWLLFVGPAKTGTSWVDRVLRGFDGVSLPQKVKETFFFDKHFDKGVRWYLEQFPQGRSDDIMVEVAPTYFFSDVAPERIAATIPEAQVVVTLREPTRRAVSHYLNLRKYGFTELDIARAVERFPNITRHSLYAARLDGWFGTFGRSNVKVVFYEEVVGDIRRLFNEVLRPYQVKPKDKMPATSQEARVNAATVPRSRTFGRLGHRVAKTLREADLYLVIELGKRLGVKKVLFGGGAQPNQHELEKALSPWQGVFAKDREALTRLLGRSPPW